MLRLLSGVVFASIVLAGCGKVPTATTGQQAGGAIVSNSSAAAQPQAGGYIGVDAGAPIPGAEYPDDGSDTPAN